MMSSTKCQNKSYIDKTKISSSYPAFLKLLKAPCGASRCFKAPQGALKRLKAPQVPRHFKV